MDLLQGEQTGNNHSNDPNNLNGRRFYLFQKIFLVYEKSSVHDINKIYE